MAAAPGVRVGAMLGALAGDEMTLTAVLGAVLVGPGALCENFFDEKGNR